MSYEDEEILEKEESVTIDEGVLYVKYKDNSTVYFTDFDSSQGTKQTYIRSLQQQHLTAVKEIRMQDMSLSTYRQFAQVRAVTTLQDLF